jgi:TolA-binding protein
MRTAIAIVLTSVTALCAQPSGDPAREAHRLRQEAEAMLVRGEDLARRGHEQEAAEAFDEAAQLMRRADELAGAPSAAPQGPEPSSEQVIHLANRLAELGDERYAERIFREGRRYGEERDRLLTRVARTERLLVDARQRRRPDQVERYEEELADLGTKLGDLEDSIVELQELADSRVRQLEDELGIRRPPPVTQPVAQPGAHNDPPVNEHARRERHYREAVEHLHAAGMPDLARFVEREGWNALHGRPSNPDEWGDEDLSRRTEELTHRVERLEDVIYDLRRSVERLSRELRRDARVDPDRR